MRKLLLLLLLSFPLAAQPVITGLTATSGPSAGGNSLQINGSGFSFCHICSPPLPPPLITFGGVPATIIAGDTGFMIVNVPAHIPGTVELVVEQSNGKAVAQNAYTYTGGIEDAFTRVLVPLLTPPVNGAFGSQFHTTLKIASRSESATPVFGLAPSCDATGGCPDVDPFENPLVLERFAATSLIATNGTPGRFIYIEKARAAQLSGNLRVYDVTRTGENFGTEIPLVRDEEMIRGSIKLLGIPLDERFRKTLRIYMAEPQTFSFTVGDEEYTVTPEMPNGPFEPAYYEFTDFPAGTGTVDIEIHVVQILPFPPPPHPPVWAFVSVTNNDTQLITTITPQPVRTNPAASASN